MNNNLEVLIFSKNRAMQVDLLLRTIQDNWPELLTNLSILYTYTNDSFRQGYKKLRQKYPKINFILQDNFQSDTLIYLNQSPQPLFMFLNDDDVVLKKPSPTLFELFDAETISIPLRMARNMTKFWGERNTPDNCVTSPYPDMLIDNGEILKWNWTTTTKHWAYVMAVCSTIYRTEALKHLLPKLKFNTPSPLEAEMMNNGCDITKPFAICDVNCCIPTIPNNSINNWTMSSENPIFQMEHLNALFLQGKQISTTNIYAESIWTSHQLIDFHFEQPV